MEVHIDTSISKCFFDRCKVDGYRLAKGGAINIESASVTISSCTFAGCASLTGGGGAISFFGTSLLISDTSFLSCVSSGVADDSNVGGALRFVGGGVICVNCSFLNCRNNLFHGGGIGEFKSSERDITASDVIKLEKCLFVSNYAGVAGGAIELKTIKLECVECSFLHNSANDGGVIAGDLTYSYTFDRCLLFENIARVCGDGRGAAIFSTTTTSSAKLMLKNTSFYGNKYSETCSATDSLTFFYFVIPL
jgi:hypothetical protein